MESSRFFLTLLTAALTSLLHPWSAEAMATNSSNTKNVTLIYPANATLFIGSLFPIHASRRDVNLGFDVCDWLQGVDGIQPLEAMLYTLDQINQNSDLLPGITLGALALDSCESPSVALDQALGFIKGRKFGWTYASVVYSRGEYGEGGFQQLKSQASRFHVCFASPSHRLAKDDSDDTYKEVVTALLARDASVVVVFANDEVTAKLMETVQLHGHYSRIVWVGSDGWSSSSPKRVEAVVEGAIAVRPLVNSLPGFDEYFRSLTPAGNQRNPWFEEYCAQENCPPASASYAQAPWLHFVRDAVYAFAHALHNMWEARCEGKSGLCDAMAHSGHVHGHELFGHLLNVSFEDVNGRNFQFDKMGAAFPRYSILNYQRVDNYNYMWVPVGTYSRTSDGKILELEESSVKFRQDYPPVSSCGTPCKPGEAKILLQDKCCWRCEPCRSYQYLDNSTQLCKDCDECKAPDESKSVCKEKEERFIDYKNRWAITSLAFASLGIFSTVLVAVIFWVYLDTPVIKASSRELSYILLAGIFLSFAMTFVIVAPPTFFTCGITRFFLGFCYTVCYAAILTKTNRISRIFNKNPGKPHKAKYTSPRSQMVIVTLLVSVEVIINISWLVYYSPSTKHLCSRDTKYRIRICNGLDDYSYIVGLIYPLVLVCFCTVYAIKTRKCPGGFNEARFIAFTNYTTCLIWLVFVPLYLSTGASDDVRIVTLAMSLSLGGFVQLGCLFFPKVHIVLFKPEKNTKDAVMSIQRTSSYRAGSIRQQPSDNLQHHSAPAIIFLNSKPPVKPEGGGLQIPQFHDQNLNPNDVPGLVNKGFFTGMSSKPQEPTVL
ncbi:metabotropic glutamate receptor-like [Penaeus indicus]|uniref:metabotropic glutamate receptor-like n=1 Tax=Penaeus indicus TaxID=29960 RepID=UPI00300CB3FD